MFDFDTHLDAYLLGLEYALSPTLIDTSIHQEYMEKYYSTEYQDTFTNALKCFDN